MSAPHWMAPRYRRPKRRPYANRGRVRSGPPRVAAQLGVSTDLVRQQRRASGIRPFRMWSDEARDRNAKCREADRRREVVRLTVRRRGAGRKVVADLMEQLHLSVTRVRQLISEVSAEGGAQ